MFRCAPRRVDAGQGHLRPSRVRDLAKDGRRERVAARPLPVARTLRVSPSRFVSLPHRSPFVVHDLAVREHNVQARSTIFLYMLFTHDAAYNILPAVSVHNPPLSVVIRVMARVDAECRPFL
jgi:hypothetical protein